MKVRHQEVPESVWKDKRIPYEGKIIYGYIFAKGIDRLLINLNVGELQQVNRITNQGLKNNLDILEKLKYLLYKEYDRGMYTITLLDK